MDTQKLKFYQEKLERIESQLKADLGKFVFLGEDYLVTKYLVEAYQIVMASDPDKVRDNLHKYLLSSETEELTAMQCVVEAARIAAIKVVISSL